MRNVEFSSSDPNDAFGPAYRAYPFIDYTKEETIRPSFETLSTVVGDYFYCGVQFLMNGSVNHHLREAACITDIVFDKHVVPVYVADKIPVAANMFDVQLVSGNPEQPNVGFPYDHRIGTIAKIFLPHDLVYTSQTEPLEALAGIVYVTSVIKDFANQRLHIDPQHIDPRAQALVAEFLADCGTEEIAVAMSLWIKQMWADYPKGLQSLKPEMLYQPRYYKLNL